MQEFSIIYHKHRSFYTFYLNEEIVEDYVPLKSGEIIDLLDDWFGKDKWNTLEKKQDVEGIYYVVQQEI